MENKIQIYDYQGQQIEFDLNEKSIMVNATEMAKPFGKLPKDFLRTDPTKEFIQECLRKDLTPYGEFKTEADLFRVSRNGGTWMHRLLALKFAAWLSPQFEVWVYYTIDELLFGKYRALEESLRASARRKKRMNELKDILASSDDYLELERLALEERQASYSRSKTQKIQLDLFLDLE